MSGSDFTTTPKLGLYKPIYDHDDDTWGTHLNANADVLDAQVATHNDLIAAVPAPSNSIPLGAGTAAAGIIAAYARGDHVHPTDVTRAPLASPVFTGSPSLPAGTTAVTAAPGDADTSVATTAFVTAAQAGAAANNVGRNRLHNGGFRINQRNYVSGTALAAAAYGFDRWKAGAGGCTYGFTATPPATTITITAGTLQQVVEALNVEGGSYMLSWSGTAQGRVNAGAYAASPVTVAGLPANTAITVEFNAGTLGAVQLEPGTVATAFEQRDIQQELARCQRFYQVGDIQGFTYLVTGIVFSISQAFATLMRANPTMVVGSQTMSNLGAPSLVPNAGRMFSCSATASGTGQSNMTVNWTASADL
jgi:hypothetical protein